MTEQPKKIIRGAGGAMGKKGGGTIKDNLLSDDVVEFTLGLCEGPIGGLARGPRSFYLDDTPLVGPTGENNFDPFALEIYHGDANPTIVRNTLGGISSNVQVGVRMAQNVPIIRTTPANLRNSIDQIELRLVFHQVVGNHPKGGQTNWTAEFEIQYRKAGNANWIDFFPGTPTITISGKTTSNYPKEYVLNVPRIDNDWEIRVNKLQADSATHFVVDFSFESFQCVTQEDRSYPNLAVVRGIGRSSDRFSSIPEFSGVYALKLVNVPSNYDPITRYYDGIWDGTFKIAHTDNPVWAVYDMIMDPETGLKSRDPDINADRFSFYDAAKWCDELVPIPNSSNFQPRWTYNDLISTQRQGIDLIYHVCGLFGGVPDSDRNGNVVLRVDRPGAIVQIFGAESVENGAFSYQRTDVTERKNDITVKFTNPNLGWVEDARRVFDQDLIDTNGRLNEQMTAIGCIDPHEAQRRAYRRLLQANTEQLTVSFTTTRAGISLELFQLIGIADPDMNWGLSGRVVSQESGTIQLRDTLFVPVNTDMTFTIQTPSGPHDLTVQSASANTKQLTITGGTWPVDTPEFAQFTLGAAGIGLVKPFRIIEIRPDGDSDRITITALEHNVNKYGDVDNLASTGTVDYDFEGSGYPEAPVIDLVESGDPHVLVTADGRHVNRILVRWVRNPKSMSSRFEVAYRVKDEEDFQFVPVVGPETYLSYMIPGKVYEIKVRGINPLGRKGPFSDVVEHTMTGRTTLPENVPAITASILGRNISLGFADLNDPEIDEYLVREGVDWDTGTPIGSTSENHFIDTNVESPDRTYHVKAKTFSGLLSETATSVSVSIPAPSAPNSFTITSDVRSVLILAPITANGNFRTYNLYAAGSGATFASATLVGTFTGNQFSYAPAAGEEKYWLTEVDVWGRESVESAPLSGTPLPVELEDLAASVTTAIDTAAQSAAGDVAAAEAAATIAQSAQTAAAASEAAASASEAAAGASATAAGTAQTAAETAQAAADTAAAAAAASQTAASGSATSASTAQAAAEAARDGVLERFSPLAAIDVDILANAVDVFVYDTRLDYDGGAWRKRCHNTSWYNETLNTSTRGSRREFPQVAVIVAESNKVTIYDGDDPALPMWMVFNSSAGGFVYVAGVKSVSALNGHMFAGLNTGSVGCLPQASFANDSYFFRNSNGTQYNLNTISERNKTGGPYAGGGIPPIVNSLVNDVAITVLPDAPIDPDTGLPVPTIAVATNGGVSVIKDDGTVSNPFSSYGMVNVQFDADGAVVYSSSGDHVVRRSIDYTSNVGILDAYGPAGVRPVIGNSTSWAGVKNLLNIGPQKFAAYTTAAAGRRGVSLAELDYSNILSGSMVANIADDHNTGWMVGDVRGAWLSDTDETDLVEATPLEDDFSSYTDQSSIEAGGWTPDDGDTVLSIATGALRVENGAANYSYASRSFATTPGQTYEVIVDASDSTGTARVDIGTSKGGANLGRDDPAGASETLHITFTATTATAWVSLFNTSAGLGTYAEFDNISVKLVDKDRSVNNNGLVVNGTVTRSPVATGAELVGYAFGSTASSNWLKDDNFSITSSEFSVIWWSKDSGNDREQFTIDDGTNSTYNPAGGMHSWTYNQQLKTQLNGGTFHTPVGSIPANQWNMFSIVVSGGVLRTYINGAEALSSGTTVSNPTQTHLWIGNGYYNGRSQGMALFRISETAPTAEQIKKIYNDEKVLFQENAACTLYGSSDAVTALAYDEDTQLLHVGTSAGRSEFRGLRRVSNTTDPVTKSISAKKGLIAET